MVEDCKSLADLLAEGLSDQGIAAEVAYDGTEAASKLSVNTYDVVVLDRTLPGIPGDTLCQMISGSDQRCMVLMLSGSASPADRTSGLGLGADDYLVKPFALEELMARVRAVLRRHGTIPQVVEIEGLLVDEEHGLATRAGRELGLTATELRLLVFLIRHRGQALSKDQLLTQVWGYDAYDHNLVEVHISGLRRKLEQHGPRVIHTVRGIGYRFSA